MAKSEFDIRHASPLVWVGQQRLAEKRQLVDKDRRFAHASLVKFTFNADEVAEIEQLCEGPARIAQLFLSQVNLHLARPIPNVEKLNLTLDAALHNSSGGADAWALALGLVGGQLADIGDRLVSLKSLVPRIDAEGLDLPELFGTDLFEVAFVGHGWVFRAGSPKQATDCLANARFGF